MRQPLRNLAVGHFYNEPFIAACAPWTARIREVFFAWPGVLSCRPAPDFTDAVRRRLRDDLRWCRENGILLDTLFNCNCYGDEAISPALADFVEATLRDMDAAGLFPDVVTTTSPFIASVLRRRFPPGGDPLERQPARPRHDGLRERGGALRLLLRHARAPARPRLPRARRRVGAWARAHGKAVGMQANSGCLRQCPFQTFHDNLHGHNRIRQSAVGEAFDFGVFRCRDNYARKRWEDFIRATWIRPEDLPLFEPHVSVVKLATRRHPCPTRVLAAYAAYAFDGNLLDLMAPVHADLFAPYAIDNAAFPADFASTVGACPDANDCRHCGRCAAVLARVLKKGRP